MEVTLEEIYVGGMKKKLEYKRHKLCGKCNGDGGPKEARESCEACGGAGRATAFTFMGLSAFDAVIINRIDIYPLSFFLIFIENDFEENN